MHEEKWQQPLGKSGDRSRSLFYTEALRDQRVAQADWAPSSTRWAKDQNELGKKGPAVHPSRMRKVKKDHHSRHQARQGDQPVHQAKKMMFKAQKTRAATSSRTGAQASRKWSSKRRIARMAAQPGSVRSWLRHFRNGCSVREPQQQRHAARPPWAGQFRRSKNWQAPIKSWSCDVLPPVDAMNLRQGAVRVPGDASQLRISCTDIRSKGELPRPRLRRSDFAVQCRMACGDVASTR